jgi:FxsC-like protein
MENFWFFVSYARRNDLSYNIPSPDDSRAKLIRRFYEDLAAEIVSRAQTGEAKRADKIGFFDQIGIELGDKWHVPVADALRSCKTMLCLLTDNYFASKVAGQEFQIFSSRIGRYTYAKKLKEPPPLIIPLLWHAENELTTPLPKALSQLQYRHDEYGKTYAEEGLEKLLRLDKYKDHYNEFLIKLAIRIIGLAKEYSVPPLEQSPALLEAKNAFEPEPAAPGPTEFVSQGPGVAHFAFVAGQNEELQAIRKQVQAYGLGGRFWKPYVPDVDQAVGLMTQRAATEVGLQHEVMPVTKDLVDRLEKADDTNTIVVLIIDPWSLNLQLYQEQMQRYDKRNLVSCAVLVVWNEKDLEPDYNLNALRQKIKSTFPNNLTNNNTYMRPAVCSEEELRTGLCKAIVEIRRRLNERAKLFRSVDDAGFSSLPQIVAATAPGANA